MKAGMHSQGDGVCRKDSVYCSLQRGRHLSRMNLPAKNRLRKPGGLGIDSFPDALLGQSALGVDSSKHRELPERNRMGCGAVHDGADKNPRSQLAALPLLKASLHRKLVKAVVVVKDRSGVAGRRRRSSWS